jgi:sodium-dependent dicarboxylate transporter 2/3/5
MMHTGVSPGKVIAGFMLATAFLSMWISNTATAMMMLPIAISVLGEFESIFNEKDLKKYSIALLLSIAYSASIGGIATLVGTPPNLVFIKIMNISFPNAPEIGFGQWLVFALPLSAFMLISLWLLMYFMLFKKIKTQSKIPLNIFRTQYAKLGKYSYEEKIVTTGFLLFALLLLFRTDIKISNFTIFGWSNMLPNSKFINDGTIAIAISILFFIIPSKKQDKGTILDWQTANKLPWQIIILFGGGFALAKGFISSGLSLWIGELIENSVFDSLFFNILLITTVMIFLTEVTSNTATTQILLPILSALAISTKTNPLIYMIPATIAASMAFMLPVATPPNAIVFGSGKIKISEMAKFGLLLNIIAIILVSIFVYYLGGEIFNINTEFPSWAIKTI